MENSLLKKIRNRHKRALRVRAKVRGDEDKPRLCVQKTNLHIHLQLVDDVKGMTLASASTVAKEFKDTEYGKKSKNSAKQMGLKIAQLAKEKNIKKAIFDRGPHKYHGIVAAVAEGAREGGARVIKSTSI